MLIILATVTVTVVLGEDGLIRQAEKAKEHQANAEASDREAMDSLDEQIANALSGDGTSGDSEETPDEEESVLVTGVTLNKESTTIAVGATETLTATIEPSDATTKTLTWSSSDTNVATVDENGVVTAVAGGSATITATTTDGSNILATCQITVPEPVPTTNATHTATNLNTSTYTWEVLNQIAKKISDNDETITKETAEVKVNINGTNYTVGVGDTTTLTIGNTNYVVRILGFNHDRLTSTSAYGGTNTYAGISFEFVDFLTTAAMNGTSGSDSTNAGGWAASQMYTTVSGYKDEVDTAMTGSSTSSYLKQVQKKYLATYNSSAQSTSNDYLWLLACSEIWSKGARLNGNSWVLTEGAYGYAYATEGDQYKYYKIKETGYSSYGTVNNDFKKPSTAAGTSNSGSVWWLRSPDSRNASHFCGVNIDGTCDTYYSCVTVGVVPGFSI